MVQSKAATYAVLAVTEIALRNDGRGTRSREIASLFELPAAYAAKVMTQLSRAGVLSSERGPQGGFRLARSPEEINFLEIIEAVDGALHANRGLHAMPQRRRLREEIDALFDRALERVREHLRRTTLADFLRSHQAGQQGTSDVAPRVAPPSGYGSALPAAST